MAAALACLGILQRDNTVATLRRSGQMLMDGLVEAGQQTWVCDARLGAAGRTLFKFHR